MSALIAGDARICIRPADAGESLDRHRLLRCELLPRSITWPM
jgi:hypothetical protein